MIAQTPLQTDDELREAFVRRCDRIAAADPVYRVFVPGTFERQRILGQVAALSARFADPAARPPLFGVPVGVKDIFHCDGFVTRCGSRLPPELFQGAEADSVTRLKEAGAVVMGKTATTEFAYFAPAPTRNPVNPDHTPGGSSSGSAAGVAAGFFDYALGTQTIGSVIRPAAYCGIAGFKPSLGRISTAGVVPFSSTVDHVGVFARTAAELPPLMAVLDDQWQAARAPGRIRLGIPAGAYLAQAEAPALEVFDRQVRRLQKGGCEIIEVAVLEDIREINARHERLVAAEIARVHAPWFEAHIDAYHPATRRIITAGMAVADEELDGLRRSCLRLRSDLAAAMAVHRLDAWVCPAAIGEAPLGLATTGSPLMNLPWTHAGVPAATIASAKGPAGLPLGLQLAGDFMADETLLTLAAALEELLPAREGREESFQ